MNLNAPTLMVAVVAGIGLYAGYRMVKNRNDDVLPEGAESELALLGDPLKLSTNRYYRARLRVRELGMPPFLSTANRETLQGALEALGFSGVKVYMTVDELPSDWPASTKKNAGPMTRFFDAQWKRANVSLPRPPDVESIWIARPPATPDYAATVSGAMPPGGYRLRFVPAEITWGAPDFNNQIPLDENGEVSFNPGAPPGYRGVVYRPHLPKTMFEEFQSAEYPDPGVP